MKTIIEIQIVENEKQRREEIRLISTDILKGTITGGRIRLILTPDLFGKIFSPKRIELLMHLSIKKKENVSELARALNRQFEVVYRDLKIFENFGLIKMVKLENEVLPELIGEIRLPIIA
ncbi:hypothetical protein C4580_05200 [Candidatus Woesearchaeota archaeon]|nr:MAG: hypothetical protein C4580_05200 [Candidatus Woesearchaeota archaeon]